MTPSARPTRTPVARYINRTGSDMMTAASNAASNMLTSMDPLPHKEDRPHRTGFIKPAKPWPITFSRWNLEYLEKKGPPGLGWPGGIFVF